MDKWIGSDRHLDEGHCMPSLEVAVALAASAALVAQPPATDPGAEHQAASPGAALRPPTITIITCPPPSNVFIGPATAPPPDWRVSAQGQIAPQPVPSYEGMKLTKTAAYVFGPDKPVYLECQYTLEGETAPPYPQTQEIPDAFYRLQLTLTDVTCEATGELTGRRQFVCRALENTGKTR